MPKETWRTLHESVIVGYFCQAVGWIARDTRNLRASAVPGRKLDALNLSHNPFDPAVGDLLLKAKSTTDFPQEYYIFELKVDWGKGVLQERDKLVKKSGTAVDEFDDARAEAFSIIPKANTAHLFGAVLPDLSGHRAGKLLYVASYWEAVREKVKELKPLVEVLSAVVKNEVPGSGFNIEELESYPGTEQGRRRRLTRSKRQRVPGLRRQRLRAIPARRATAPEPLCPLLAMQI